MVTYYKTLMGACCIFLSLQPFATAMVEDLSLYKKLIEKGDLKGALGELKKQDETSITFTDYPFLVGEKLIKILNTSGAQKFKSEFARIENYREFSDWKMTSSSWWVFYNRKGNRRGQLLAVFAKPQQKIQGGYIVSSVYKTTGEPSLGTKMEIASPQFFLATTGELRQGVTYRTIVKYNGTVNATTASGWPQEILKFSLVGDW